MTEFKVRRNYNESEGDETLLRDSQNPVDFVLVYGGPSKNVQHYLVEEKNKEEIRSIFEKCLKEEGLEIEKDTTGSLVFVKISVPRHVLAKNCEILKLKMPLKKIEAEKLDRTETRERFDLIHKMKTFGRKTIRAFVTIDPKKCYEEKNTLYAEYSRDKSHLFDENDPNFFDYSVRVVVITHILDKIPWGEDASDSCRIGIESLIEEDVYEAAYPLHDGGYTQEGSLRNHLRVEWANAKSWIKLQPIDDIKDYLGVKSAFYFAWLGFYTRLLIPASILGLIVFFYGILTINGDILSNGICNKTNNITMCPLCDNNCDYWKLSETCGQAQITHMFDNTLTIVFALVMSVWATLFLESWKRHAAVLSHRWGLTDYSTQAEHPRPQYSAKLAGSKKKINEATGQPEVELSFWSEKLPSVIFSYTIILFFISVVIVAVFSIVLYRMWMMQANSGYDRNKPHISLRVIISTTAVTMNLISIMILNKVYYRVAIYLTNLELPRTQTDFENSLSIKMYIFQFVNYYSALMYIVLLKGKFVGYPKKYNRIFGFRQEECSLGGCLIEMSIQLVTIMVGQQILGTILEILTPIIWKQVNQNSLRKSFKNEKQESISGCKKQWIKDYKLLDWKTEGLFWEYLEMVIQFGFVTLFAAAFPLAPIFALLNNIFELRLDARKILKYYKRPVPHRVPNIGAWYRILDVVGKIAVVSNATIIAFSSNFIPKLVYWYFREHDELGSFLEFCLSSFNTTDFDQTVAPVSPTASVSICRYYGYRADHLQPNKYKRTEMHWKIMVMRLLFILIFQNIVFIVKTALQWLIPDIPHKLSDRIKQENRLITELMATGKTKVNDENSGRRGKK